MNGFVDRYLNRHVLFEFAPGLIFFLSNELFTFKVALYALLISTLVVVCLGVYIEKRVPVFPLIGIVLLFVLGGLTLFFNSEGFIKIKPTIGKLLFTLILLLGLKMKPTLLSRALQGQVYLTDHGWTVLTLSWIGLAILFAIANEIIRRYFDTDAWVLFSSFVMPFSIVGYIVLTRITAMKYWNKS